MDITIAATWVFVSGAALIFGNLAFFLWLRSLGVEVRFFYAGVPFYLDGQYVAWCRQRRLSPRRVLLVRAATVLNLFCSFVILLVVLARQAS